MENSVREFKNNWFKDAEAKVLIVGKPEGATSTRLIYSRQNKGSVSSQAAKDAIKTHLEDKLDRVVNVELKKYNGCCPGAKDSEILTMYSCSVEGHIVGNKKLESSLKAQGYSYDYEFDFDEIIPGKKKKVAVVYFFKAEGRSYSDRIRQQPSLPAQVPLNKMASPSNPRA